MTEPTHTPQPGKVIFVGAGPGNPELLTVRAREVMESNSIALVDPEVSAGVRSVIGSALPVPKAKMDAANARYEQMCAEAKAAGRITWMSLPSTWVLTGAAPWFCPLTNLVGP